MRDSKKKYLEEYEKYKDVELVLNEVYSKASRTSEKVELVEIDETAEVARIKNLRTEVLQKVCDTSHSSRSFSWN